MKYVYPAIFHPFEDGSKGYMVTFPDIPGCLTEGFSLDEAIQMAQSALQEMMAYYEDKGLNPENPPSDIKNLEIEWEKGQFPTLISIETRDYSSVRKTVSLPQWMVEKAEEQHLSLSRTLQIALEERLS